MLHDTNLLIIGAGPFGLTLAAYAQEHGIDYQIVGKPMDFWKTHMPLGMYLRSGYDWHLDPGNVHTIAAYLATRQRRPSDVAPLPLQVYLDYTAWFQQQAAIDPLPRMVQQLDHAAHGFTATLDTGATITAQQVVLALGMQYFTHIPDEYTRMLPPDRYAHTRDLVDFGSLRGKRCLIIGGRQSAFEWAALLHEAGAAHVHLVYRHATPAFTTSDWSWVSPLVDRMLTDAGWFRRRTPEQKTAIQQPKDG